MYPPVPSGCTSTILMMGQRTVSLTSDGTPTHATRRRGFFSGQGRATCF